MSTRPTWKPLHTVEAAVLVFFLASHLYAQPAGRADLAIVGGFLLDGFGGPPRPNAVVLVRAEEIVAVGDEGTLEIPAGVEIIDANGYTVMPGLIDTHVHLDILGHGDYPTWHAMVRENYAEVMELSAAQLVAHGVTTARDAGGELESLVRTRERIERGEIRGPRLLIGGGWIQNWPDERARSHHRRFNVNVHSAEEARAATRELIDGGAEVIKAYTGLTLEQMEAITDEAHRLGKIVGAHVYTDEEIQTAIRGGVDFLDHAGSGHQNPLYGEETLRLMALTQIPIGQSISHRVTLYPAHLAWPERIDDPMLAKELGRFAEPIRASLRDFSSLSYFWRIHLETRLAPRAAAQLFAAGCKIIMGTDSGTPGFFHRDAVWREADALVRLAGMSPNEVILAATKHAAETLRVNAGVIQPGKLADIILVKGNPLESVLYLQNVELVIKAGKVQ
ncbi:MAG TPA: amidohydrolase family protein [Vicinamibacteria bacterium]|nr:amidohydrolase family protein [Vicinamibacteria bacterium]